MNRGVGSLEFSIVPNNPQTRMLSIIFSMPFFVFFGLVLGSFATGEFNAQDVVILTMFLTLVGGFVIWNIQRYGHGAAMMDSSELVVRTRGWTHRYAWPDVGEVLLTSFAERGSTARVWARILRWPVDEPFVELKLKRALRTGLWPGRYGTRVKGIPLIGGAQIELFVDEPESFVRSARSYLASTDR